MAKTVTNMAKTRYYDWIITTPAMHLTTIIYFDYLYRIENKLDMVAWPIIGFSYSVSRKTKF
jgi:hypothetical protein